MALPIPQLLKIMLDEGGDALFLIENSPPCVRINCQIRRIEHPLLSRAEILNMFMSATFTKYQLHLFNHGYVSFTFGIKGLGPFRANWIRRLGRLSGTFRRINYEIRSLDKIGINNTIWGFPSEPGLCLVAGSARSGRTTTLAAILDLFNIKKNFKICLIHNGTHPFYSHKKSIFEDIVVEDDAKDVKKAVEMAVYMTEADCIAIDGFYGREAFEAMLFAAQCGICCYATVYGQSVEIVIQTILNEWTPGERGNILLTLSRYLNLILCQALLNHANGKGNVLAFELLYCTKEVRTLIEIGRLSELRKVFSDDYSAGRHISMKKSLERLVKRNDITKDTKERFFDIYAKSRKWR